MKLAFTLIALYIVGMLATLLFMSQSSPSTLDTQYPIHCVMDHITTVEHSYLLCVLPTGQHMNAELL